MSYHKTYIFSNEIKDLSSSTASDYIQKLASYLKMQSSLTNNFDIVTRDYTSGDYTYYCMYIAPKNRYIKLSADESPLVADKIVIYTNNYNEKVQVNTGGYGTLSVNAATALGHLNTVYANFAMIFDVNNQNDHRFVFYDLSNFSKWISTFYTKNNIGDMEYVTNYYNGGGLYYSYNNQRNYKNASMANLCQFSNDSNKYIRPYVASIAIFPNLYQVLNCPQGINSPYKLGDDIYIESCNNSYQGLAIKY